MNHSLTTNLLKEMFLTGSVQNIGQPIFQFLSLSPINKPGAGPTERYKVFVSDGEYLFSGMLASQLNNLVKQNKLRDGAIVKVVETIFNEVKGRKILFLLNVAVIEEQHAMIGNPVNLDNLAKEGKLPTINGNDTMQIQSMSQSNMMMTEPVNHMASMNAPQTSSTAGNSMNAFSNVPSYMKKESMAANSSSSDYRTSSSSSSSSSSVPSVGYSLAPLPSRDDLQPIHTLQGYQNHFRIRGRVQNKSDLRSYNGKNNQPGQMFNMDFVDDMGEIRITAFNDTATKYYNLFEIGKSYILANTPRTNEPRSHGTRSSIKAANKKFNRLNHGFEIFIGDDLEIWPIGDAQGAIPGQRYFLKNIAEWSSMPQVDSVDFAGIVYQVNPVYSFVSKSQKNFEKRVVNVVDQTNNMAEVTLWGNHAHQYDEKKLPQGAVLAIKAAKVNEFQNTKSLSVSFNSTLDVNPTHLNQFVQLAHWWRTLPSHDQGQFRNVSRLNGNGGAVGSGDASSSGGYKNQRSYISDVVDTAYSGKVDQAGRPKGDFFRVRGNVAHFNVYNDDSNNNRNPWYFACALLRDGRKCGKKVNASDAGDFMCDTCNSPAVNVDLKYVLSLSIADSSGLTWATAFDKEATALLGKKSAHQLSELKAMSRSQYIFLMHQNTWKDYLFVLVSTMETGRDNEERKRVRIFNVEPLNYAAEGKLLLEEIRKYEGM